MAESSSQVVDSDPAADATQSTTPIKNGKRGAEEPQVVSNKKHKIVEKTDSAMEESIKEENTVEVALGIELQDDGERASISNEEDNDNDDCSKAEHQHLESPKTSVETDPVDATRSTNPVNGKRDAEEVVEPQVVGNKKHKTIEKTNSGMEESIKEENKVEVAIAIESKDEAGRPSISNEEDNNDCSKDGHHHLESPKTSARKLNNELQDDMGSKTLHIGNLSFLIEEDDVRDFFEKVGGIAEIRFVIRNDKFMGYGYIEFTTAEAAQEALKLNNEVLLDRPVKLDFARRQRGAYTTPDNRYRTGTPVPDSKSQHIPKFTHVMDKGNKRGGDAEAKTVYVRGFESSDGFDNIKSALEKHFGKCGEISRLCIPKDHVSGDPRGVAFIEFTERKAFTEALRLDGSEIGGCRLTVEVANKLRNGGGGLDNRESGSWHHRESGYGGGGGRGGSASSSRGSSSSRQNVSGGSWVRESRYGRESGSGGGGWRRESGSGGGCHREAGSGSGWHREGGYRSSSSHTESGGYGKSWHRKSGGSWDNRESGSWHNRESGYGGGFSGGNGSGYGGGWGGYNSGRHHVGSLYGGGRRDGRYRGP